VPKGLPGYVGGTFFPLVGSTGGTLGLAVLVRCPVPCTCSFGAAWPCKSVPAYRIGLDSATDSLYNNGRLSCGLCTDCKSCCELQVCIIDMAESISIARALALKNRYTLAPTQVIELGHRRTCPHACLGALSHPPSATQTTHLPCQLLLGAPLPLVAVAPATG
jgi:hypothetical protein